jgi:hypothetical protein
VEEISIPRKYCRGPRSDIRNWSLRWVLTSDDHAVHVKKEKGHTTRWHVDKESRIMSVGGKTSSCDHRGKMLKPSPRSLLKAINGATKTFFTSSWEMDHPRTEATTRRVWIVVIWATGAKVSS